MGFGAEAASFDPKRFFLEGGIWSALDQGTGQSYEGAFAIETDSPRGSSIRLDRYIEAQCKSGMAVTMGAPAIDEFLGKNRIDVAATPSPIPEGFVPGHGRPPLRPVLCDTPPRAGAGISTNAMLAVGTLALVGAFVITVIQRRKRRRS